MNHLRELLEQKDLYLTNRNPKSLDDIHKMPPDLSGDLLGNLQRAAENAVCFFMGDQEGFEKFKVMPELCVMPYKTCWFESYTIKKSIRYVLGVLTETKENGEIIVYSYHKMGYAWVLGGGTIVKCLHDAICQERYSWCEHAALSAVCAFLCALNCENVAQLENVPDEKLQKARMKRGKKPLFSYKTLVIVKTERGKQKPVGTHSSPRLHLRRGHARRVPSGKVVFVRPCTVGDGKLGMVHKDYDGSKLS